MSVSARFDRGDPPGGSVLGGDLPVQGHRDLEGDPGPPGNAMVEIPRIEGEGLSGTDACHYLDPGSAKGVESPTGNTPVGILQGDHYPGDSRGDDGLGARRGLAMVGTGFEGDVKSGALRRRPRFGEGEHFRVRASGPGVTTSPDDAPIPVHNDRSYSRIRVGTMAPRCGYRRRHHFAVHAFHHVLSDGNARARRKPPPFPHLPRFASATHRWWERTPLRFSPPARTTSPHLTRFARRGEVM